MKTVLVTGAAGFIGHVTALMLLRRGYAVIGLDNMNDYYDVRLKEYRLAELERFDGFRFHRLDIENRGDLDTIGELESIDGVINLAARAGVRYSMVDPFVYFQTNCIGTLNLLDLAVRHSMKKFVLASTSSLYAGQPMPFSEDLPVNEPISPYAASKKGAEAIAYTYSHLYGIDVTVLRYFTVYGPAGRPDMSPYRFIKWIDEGTPIRLYGDGTQERDFTFVDDIAEGTVRAFEARTAFETINLGGSEPHTLNHVIGLMEKYLGKHCRKTMLPVHITDMKATWADIGRARRILNWAPAVPLDEGIARTVAWHRKNEALVQSIPIDLSR
ncbi:MAG: SDR family NAD(P)-dependent oxidoreductase [Candidatus Latescibacteria bacterium]|nr:SDR family NAD(P)-dependent oxidoreductase [Candidatus Latescibacterota bacterium]